MRLSERIVQTLIPDGKGFVSITGGGGKTTLLSLLGSELASKGSSVLLTTTTKVMSPHIHDYGVDRIFEDESVLSYQPKRGEIVFYAEHHSLDMKKWISPREEVLSALARAYDAVVVEADGSRGLPFKIHTARDPVIHPLTTATIAVAGLWGIGKKAYAEAFGEDRDLMIDRGYLSWYLEDESCISKGMKSGALLLYNGADTAHHSQLEAVRGLSSCAFSHAWADSLKEDRVYEDIF